MKEQLAKDNPYWPNSSAEDKSRDEAAGLPPPKMTEAGEWEVSEKDVECLAIGAGILGCGGGGDPYAGRLRALQQLQKGKKIKIINPCRYIVYDAHTNSLCNLNQLRCSIVSCISMHY